MKVKNCPSRAVMNWCKQHEHMIAEVDYGYGYSTRTGMAYDILLETGYCEQGEDGLHTVIEETVQDTLSALRSVSECFCEDCMGRRK